MKYFLLFSLFSIHVKAINLENYHQVRPNILQTTSQKLNPVINVESLLKPLMHGVALLFTSFPAGTHFYFLARDAEYIYDIAKLLSPNKEFSDRLHLLNVSTFLATNPNLTNYLKQNQLSEERLKKGQKNVFIETGFLGTVPDLIKAHFSANFFSSFYVFMFQSDSLKYNSVYSVKKHTSVRGLEQLPHFTKTAFDYHFDAFTQEYVPVAQTQSVTDKEKSLALMQNILYQLSTEEYKKYFKGLVSILSKIDTNPNKRKKSNLVNNLLKDQKAIKDTCLFCTQNIYEKTNTYNVFLNNWKSQSQKDFKVFAGNSVLYFNANPQKKLSAIDIQIIKTIALKIDSSHDVEKLEDVVLSLLPALLKEKSVALNTLLLNVGVNFKGEELIEKMLWIVSKDVHAISEYEDVLLKVVNSLLLAEKPEVALLILKNNFSVFFKQQQLPRLKKSVDNFITKLPSDKQHFFKFPLKSQKKLQRCMVVFN